MPTTLSRFWGPRQLVPRHYFGRSLQLAVRRPFGPFTKLSDPPSKLLGKAAAEPTLRNHWQRDVHACSENTFAYLQNIHNRNLLFCCAKPVDGETCLWKMAEKADEIYDLLRTQEMTGLDSADSTLDICIDSDLVGG